MFESMSTNWFQRLEEKLDERLSDFLSTNSYQEKLLENEIEQNKLINLTQERQYVQEKANKTRDNLLEIVKSVKDWKARCKKAQNSGSKELALKASRQLKKLMQEGNELWEELDHIGVRFKEINSQILSISKQDAQKKTDFTNQWTNLEVDRDLEEMRKQTGANGTSPQRGQEGG